MALNLSKEQRAELEAILAKAEPYEEDDPALYEWKDAWNSKPNSDRWSATMAKRFLEQDDREKAELAAQANK